MKRSIGVLVGVMCVGILAGCSQNSAKSESNTKQATSAKVTKQSSQQVSKSSASSQSSQSSSVSASSSSSTTAAAKSSSSSDPNVVFGQTLTDTEWFVLAYSERWQQSISELASVPDFDIATSGDHPTINQGTGDSAALLTGSSTTDTSVSLNIPSGPSYQATYHTITYSKADLKAKHLTTAADVTALNNLVSQATARGDQDSGADTE